MKRIFLLIIAIVALSISGSHAQFPSIPILGGGVSKDKNCDQPKYYKMGVLCQDTNDGRLYKGDGNQIIEIAAGTSEGDMLGAEYAVGKKIKPSAGGTGLDTSASTGFPSISSGTWSVLSVASVKAALGFLTSTDFPVTGVETPTPGMIPKWGSSGNTLVDGFAASDFQAALTNPVTGAATTTQGMIPVWGATSNTLVDGYTAAYFQAALTTFSTITSLWKTGEGACSGYLKSDGTCDTPSGGGGGYTNLTSFLDQTAWRLFYSDANGDVKELALGSNGQYLMSNGAGAVPTWSTPSGGGSGFDITANYNPTGAWNWTGATGTTWPTFNQNTTGNAATATNATNATTATNLSSYAVLYDGSVTDGHIVRYDDTTKKLKDAGAAVGYTEPGTNLPLCRTGSGTVGACTNLTDVVVPQGGGGGYTNLTSFVSQTPWRLFYSNTSGVVTELALGVDGQYLKSNGASAAPTWDTPQGGGNGIDYTPPEDPAPLCSDETGAIVACTNLEDVALTELDGAPDDVGVKIITVTGDPEEVIKCEGKDRVYIVGANEDYFFQLPDDAAGIRYCFGNGEYGTEISIVPGTGNVIMYGTSTTSSGQGIVSPKTVQDYVCLLGISNSRWRTTDSMGAWTVASVTLPEPEEPPPTGDCTTPTGNVLTESFGEGSSLCWADGPATCNNTWTVIEGTPTITDVPEGAPDNTACDKGLHLVRTDAYINLRYDLGVGSVTDKDATINFTLYIDSSSLAAWSKAMVAALNDTTGPMVGGNPDIHFSLYRYAGSTGPANAIAIYSLSDNSECFLEDIVEDTWYNVTITLDGSNGENASSMSIGAGPGQSCAFTGRTTNGRYLWLGLLTQEADVYIGNARVSASGGE